MNELSDQELYAAIVYTRNINETDGQNILTNFHIEQPALAETIFNMFPAIVAEKNLDMSNLFMDQCFDAICIYEHVFGKAPIQTEEWLISQMEALESEFLNLKTPSQTGKKQAIKIVQMKLLNVLKESIDDYASENSSRVPYIELTQNLVTATLQLLESMYKKEALKLH